MQKSNAYNGTEPLLSSPTKRDCQIADAAWPGRENSSKKRGPCTASHPVLLALPFETRLRAATSKRSQHRYPSIKQGNPALLGRTWAAYCLILPIPSLHRAPFRLPLWTRSCSKKNTFDRTFCCGKLHPAARNTDPLFDPLWGLTKSRLIVEPKIQGLFLPKWPVLPGFTTNFTKVKGGVWLKELGFAMKRLPTVQTPEPRLVPVGGAA